MSGPLTATRHKLDFNLLSFDKFEELCLWLVEDLGKYKTVEHYGGTGDKNRDIIGYNDNELDYFQCKRCKKLTYSILKSELDSISKHVKEKKIKRPRCIYFLLSSFVSPNAKDKIKIYAKEIDLPEVFFWGPVILDKKVKQSPKALKNFFGISDKKEEHLPQVDTTELIAHETNDITFKAVNNSNILVIDCSCSLMGFACAGYSGTPTAFNLKPQETIDLKITIPNNFMKQNPIKELRIRFKFRNNENNWYYSERMLNVEQVDNSAFYRIKAEAGKFIPTKPLGRFSIDSVETLDPTGDGVTSLVTYTYNGEQQQLIVKLSHTILFIWQFEHDEVKAAFQELAEKKIAQMIKTGKFENKFVVNTYLKQTQKTGFYAYKELRDSIY